MASSPSPLKSTHWASFRALNICQFIGAMNDNLFKLLLVYCFIHIEGISKSNLLLSLAGAIYVLPFLFLATTSGTLADRYSKRSIIIWTRVIELIALFLGTLSFALANKTLGFFALFLLACHSAIFGPSKYGIVPEIVKKEDISKVNGLLTLFTYTAIIIGTFFASFLTSTTNYNFILASFFPIFFSFIALFATKFIRKTPAAGSTKKVSPKLISEMIHNIQIIRREPKLLSAVFGSAFFLFIGSFIQLNIIPFALYSLHLSEVQGGYLFLLVAFGIGLGSFLAGKFSGKAVEFGLVPIGGVCIAVCFFLLHYYVAELSVVLPLIFVIGVCGGLYLVPLDSYIQIASPPTYRGQVVATSNFFGFLGVLFSAMLLYFTAEVLQLLPDQAFTLMGYLVLGWIFFLSLSFSGYIVRFGSFLFSRLFFKFTLKNKEMISMDHPSFFFVPQSFWPWAPVLLGSQRLRIRLVTTEIPSFIPKIAKILMPLIPIIQVPDIQSLNPDGTEADIVQSSLKKGASIAVFLSKKVHDEQALSLMKAWKGMPEAQNLDFYQVTFTDGAETAQLEKLTASSQI